MTKLEQLRELIRFHSAAFGLDPLMVAAVILQESSGEQYAGRIEQFSKIWLILFGRKRSEMAGWCPAVGQLPELWDEQCCRASSFGYMQVLGETARVHGFKGQYLWALFEPEINLRYGCAHLSQCLRRARVGFSASDKKAEYSRAFLFYNGGGDKAYPDKVWSHVASGAAAKLLGTEG